MLIWLLNWAKPEKYLLDTSLHETGKKFLQSLLDKKGIICDSFEKIEIKPQFKRIDIFVEIISNNRKIAIIIEDKVKYSEHSRQLVRYIDEVKSIGFDDDNIVPIYLKTGFQHNLNEILSVGYYIFTTSSLLGIFEDGCNLGIKNEIFIDYYDYLKEVALEYNDDKKSFSDFPIKKVNEWNWWNWIGFFYEYEDKLNANWKIVPNGREKLVAFWFGGKDTDVHYEGKIYIFQPYLDVKYSDNKYFAITYRLSLNGNSQETKDLRDYILTGLNEKLVKEGIETSRPKFKKADHTIELLKIKNIDPDLNEINLVALLKKLERILQET